MYGLLEINKIVDLDPGHFTNAGSLQGDQLITRGSIQLRTLAQKPLISKYIE